MSDFNLEGGIDFDASALVDGMEDAADASEDLADGVEDTNDALFDLESVDFGMIAGGLGSAGLAGAAESALSQTQPLREEMGRLAEGIEPTNDELEDLVVNLSDETFEQDDVVNTLSNLRELGFESAEGLEDMAAASDTLADAVGASGEMVSGEVLPALRAMGEDPEDLEDHMDVLATLSNETALELSDFQRIAQQNADELDDLGLGVEDMAAILTELDEQGHDSRGAMRAFRSATNDAEGDQEELLDALDISTEAFEEQTEAVTNAETSAEEYADAANESFTASDKLSAIVDDLTLKFAGFVEPISAILPALTAGGAALAGLGSIGISVTGILGTLGTALTVLTGPIGIAAIAVGALAFLFQDELMAAFNMVSGFISDTLLPVVTGFVEDGIEFLMDKLGPVIDEFQKTADVWMDTVAPVLSDGADFLTETLGPAFETFAEIAEPIVEGFAELVETQFDIVTDVLEGIAKLLRGDFEGAWEAATDTVGDLTDDMIDALPSAEDARDAIDGFIDGLIAAIKDRTPDVTAAVRDMAGEMRALLPSSPAERGPLSDLVESGAALPATFAGGVESATDAVGSATSDMAGRAARASGGGPSASDIREALEGMALSLSGELPIDGDVATMDDVEARLERAGREADLRGTL